MLETLDIRVHKVSLPKAALRQLPVVHSTLPSTVLCWFYADALGSKDYRHQPICLCTIEDEVFLAYPEYYKIKTTKLSAFGVDNIPFAII